MTNEERDKTIAQIERIQKHLASVGETVDYLDFAIEALETHEGDLISREDAINYLMINMGWHDEDGYPVDDWEEKKSCISDLINGVPSATPKLKVGRWKRIKKPYGTYFECSECGKKLNWIDRDDFFCSKCGSDNSESTKEWFKEWDARIAEMSGGGEDADSN